ncbi:hypothetical protein RESH_00948 [Rhodopirellula europaea SH398]|uniref:Uncharacterized protein n=1 Tax=Rhodopirellula europaea SH398 TaxID=1263868 RepID=M5SA03_9BACT|nr:hypothetical protein RESH_00948 [Rhodopirellula europaea SH398]
MLGCHLESPQRPCAVRCRGFLLGTVWIRDTMMHVHFSVEVLARRFGSRNNESASTIPPK